MSVQIFDKTLFLTHRKDSAASVSTDFGTSTSWDEAQGTHEISHSTSQQCRQETRLT